MDADEGKGAVGMDDQFGLDEGIRVELLHRQPGHRAAAFADDQAALDVAVVTLPFEGALVAFELLDIHRHVHEIDRAFGDLDVVGNVLVGGHEADAARPDTVRCQGEAELLHLGRDGAGLGGIEGEVVDIACGNLHASGHTC